MAVTISDWSLISRRGHTDRLGRRQDSVERKTISIMKACELVGVSRRTIYNWLSSGKIEYVRTAGGSVRIFVDTVSSALEAMATAKDIRRAAAAPAELDGARPDS